MSESNTPTTEGNLRALAWIVTEADPSQELDAQYVYRREIDLSQAIPRPRYYRAEQKDVLADDSPWDFARFWEQCDEAGEALGDTYSVKTSFEHVAIVRAVDAYCRDIPSHFGQPTFKITLDEFVQTRPDVAKAKTDRVVAEQKAAEAARESFAQYVGRTGDISFDHYEQSLRAGQKGDLKADL